MPKESKKQRLLRLTGLAKSAWPDQKRVWAGSYYIENGADKSTLMATDEEHPRALDMLEAALLVANLTPKRAKRLLSKMRKAAAK